MIPPALRFFRYNYACSTIWSISWVALLPIYADTETNSKQFSEQNSGPLVRLYPSRNNMPIFPFRYLGFFQRWVTLLLTYSWVSIQLAKSWSHSWAFSMGHNPELSSI